MQIINNSIYYIDRKQLDESQRRTLFVPTESRHWLLTLAHDDMMYGGHLGIKKTFRKLLRFWWPKQHQDVENYVKSCPTCQKFKNPSGLPPGYLHSIPVSEVFEHVHIDMVGPLKTTVRGNSYIITATDAFSKWVIATPCQNIRTADLIRFVEEQIILIHGRPKYFISDRGTQLTSKEWNNYINRMPIGHKKTTSYHPQTNGIDERVNGTLVKILRTCEDEFQEYWDDNLKYATYVYNTTVHESIGYSPCFMDLTLVRH